MDSPRIRVDRLIEYVAVLRGLFAEGPFDFAGEHYQVTGLDGSPSPYRPGGPPIFVAGGGPRMLRFAAAHADIVGVNPSLPSSDVAATSPQDALPARIDTKFEWIREAAGPRLSELEFHAWLRWAQVTDDAHAEVQPLTARFDASTDDVLASPIVLVGSVPEIVDRLHARRERWGYSYFTLQQPVARAFAPVLAALAG
jgi:alkanesulfonate monooxygenase SsuD/methylene tetrahydromethanopterin reductase-like flavin-dependent oxidoreductase (luciferase family)